MYFIATDQFNYMDAAILTTKGGQHKNIYQQPLFAATMFGIFVPVDLLKNGYHLTLC